MPETEPVIRLEKTLFPENVLVSVSNVEDAALRTIFDDPLKETPLIVRAFWSVVTVLALPLIEPTIVELKVFVPANVLLSDKSVEEAALRTILADPLNDTPLMVRAF